LISGPTALPDPVGVDTRRVETARQMLDACRNAGRVDIVVCAAAVSDWRPAEELDDKIKKTGGAPPRLALVENPDILATLAAGGDDRAALVVGFAAETDDVETNAVAKRQRKGCDWILANDVSPDTGTFGGDRNTVLFVTSTGVESWPRMGKTEVAERLVAHVVEFFSQT
jgi:phosphopantothenoylcysteine decarboxylase/phosphopantothenate--cysteine ligase